MTETEDEDTGSAGIRLQRFLAMAGAGSRRHCEEFILTGRVTVGRETVRELGFRVVPGEQDVRLDGERVRVERKTWYLLNKPTGYLCTNSDPSGRPRVLDLFQRARLFSVGRLDENSQACCSSPTTANWRTASPIRGSVCRRCITCRWLEFPRAICSNSSNGGCTLPRGGSKLPTRNSAPKEASAIIEMVLMEGQNREIRRLMAKLGHSAAARSRVLLGPIELGDLPVGEHRFLAVGGNRRPARTGRRR